MPERGQTLERLKHVRAPEIQEAACIGGQSILSGASSSIFQRAANGKMLPLVDGAAAAMMTVVGQQPNRVF